MFLIRYCKHLLVDMHTFMSCKEIFKAYLGPTIGSLVEERFNNKEARGMAMKLRQAFSDPLRCKENSSSLARPLETLRGYQMWQNMTTCAHFEQLCRRFVALLWRPRLSWPRLEAVTLGTLIETFFVPKPIVWKTAAKETQTIDGLLLVRRWSHALTFLAPWPTPFPCRLAFHVSLRERVGRNIHIYIYIIINIIMLYYIISYHYIILPLPRLQAVSSRGVHRQQI